MTHLIIQKFINSATASPDNEFNNYGYNVNLVSCQSFVCSNALLLWYLDKKQNTAVKMNGGALNRTFMVQHCLDYMCVLLLCNISHLYIC